MLFAIRRLTNPARPEGGEAGGGWPFWSDQGNYLRAAAAWARHVPPAPASQVYEPGYPLLGSLFVHLVPFDPFLVPDLLATVVAAWWFGAIARAVLGAAPWSRETGVAVFALSSLVDSRAAALWTTPWTTTPTVALGYGALAAGLSTLTRPRARAALAAGLAGGLVAAFRPGDLPFVLPPAFLAVVLGAATGDPAAGGAATRLRMLALFGLGAGLGLGASLALHASVWGLHPSPYMILSREVGFDGRLLPLRWVLLIDRSMPETPGAGIAYAFPYLLPGLPALVVFALAGTRDGRGRAPHLVICCYTLLALAEFLSYRDLHPSGLWRFFNLHYFKWLLPIGGLYAALLCREVLAGSWRAGAGAVALAVLAFCWSPVLRRLPLQDAAIVSAHRAVLPRGLPGLADAVLLPLASPASEMDVVEENIAATSPARGWRNVVDLRAYAHDGSALLVPLRPMDGPLALWTGPRLALDTERAPLLVRQDAAFRLPWVSWPREASAELPPPMLPAGGRIDLATAGSARYLDKAWGPAGPDGRRLRDPAARLSVGVASAGRLLLTIDVGVAGGGAVRMRAVANGRALVPDMVFGPSQGRATRLLPPLGGVLSLVLVTDAGARRASAVRAVSVEEAGRPPAP